MTAILALPGAANAATFVSDNFEAGNLNNWTIGGRQLGGNRHTANVVAAGPNGLAGHLHQSGVFTEINFSQTATYNSSQNLSFDLKVASSSTPPPSPAFYGLAGVFFDFLDSSGTSLGSVGYGTATTGFFAGFANADPTLAFNTITGGVWQNYSFTTSALTSQLAIDLSMIQDTRVRFNTYSSTWPSPSVTAELWVDNFNTPAVSVVPLPGAVMLYGVGFAALFGMKRRKKNRSLA